MSDAYSGTPLAKKLGLKDEFRVLLYNQPKHYFELFSDLPNKLQILDKTESESADFIHLFCTSFDELTSIISDYKNAMTKNSLMWISWPKGKSKIETDLKRDIIREYVLSIGLVDVKVASIDENWSALKFVYRLKDR